MNNAITFAHYLNAALQVPKVQRGLVEEMKQLNDTTFSLRLRVEFHVIEKHRCIHFYVNVKYNFVTKQLTGMTVENKEGSRKHNRDIKDVAKYRFNDAIMWAECLEKEDIDSATYQTIMFARQQLDQSNDKMAREFSNYSNWLCVHKKFYTVENVLKVLARVKKMHTVMSEQKETLGNENNAYTVGNRSFVSYNEAVLYCETCDYDYNMIVSESTANTIPIDLQYFSTPVTHTCAVNEYGEKVYTFDPSKPVDVNYIKLLFNSLSYTGTRYNNMPDSYTTHDTITHVHTYNGSDGEVIEIGFSSGLVLSAKCFSDFNILVNTVLKYINDSTPLTNNNEAIHKVRQLRRGNTTVTKAGFDIVYTIEYTDKDEPIALDYSNIKRFNVKDLNELACNIAQLRIDKNAYNISAYMEIYQDGKLLASDVVTTEVEYLPSTHEKEYIKSLRLEVKRLENEAQELNAYKAFVKKYRSDELFEQFLQDERYKRDNII